MAWSTATQLVLLTLAVAVTAATRRFIRDRIDRRGYPLPPGPTPLPLLGNVLSLDSKEPWLTYTAWRAKYGDIMYIRLLDTDAIVLSSHAVAKELLERRSQVYSDRPSIATVAPYGHDYNMAFALYGEHWRLCRRIFHQTFHGAASLTFRPMQLRRARQIVLNIIQDPSKYPSHYFTFSSAVAMSSVFGYEPGNGNDDMVSMMNGFLEFSIPALTSEKAVLLKVFPFLLHVPDWFPGSSLKRDAKKAVMLRDRVIDATYQHAIKHMESEDDDSMGETMVSQHIRLMEKLDHSDRAEYKIALRDASLSAFIGAAETTTATFMAFTLAMVQHPQVWKRAQAEIDAVCGMDRLPEYDDRQWLPYVESIIRETMRWKPAGPTGIPHAITRSDIYEGFYIPKGATIIVNNWGISRDERRYPNPESFSPERFLDAQGKLTEDDPGEWAFGYGRRVCPGRHSADASLWSAIATMLATLEFYALDDGVCEVTFANGLTHHLVEFPCRLTPRAHITKEVLERALAK